MCLFRCWKYIFPHQTRYLTVEWKYEQVQNNNLQNYWKQQAKRDCSFEYTHKQSLQLYQCAQLQAALVVAVWPSLKLEGCRSFLAVASGPNSIDGSGCYSCIAHVRGQRWHKKISYYLKKMRNTIAYPTQQSSSPSRGIRCFRKRGNDDRGTVV